MSRTISPTWRTCPEVKKAADAGKFFDTAMKEVKLPKYKKLANYEASLPANGELFCYWWGRGY